VAGGAGVAGEVGTKAGAEEEGASGETGKVEERKTFTAAEETEMRQKDVVAAQAAKVAEEIGKAGKTARSLLNKLTPEKFERIANRFAAEVTVTCAQTLVAVSEVIFDKAVDEPAFCPVYARLCGFLSTRYVSLGLYEDGI
jgi:hypothetical protein